METTPTFKMPPTDTYSHEVEVHDVERCEYPCEEYLGAKIVGGTIKADRFFDAGSN